MSSLKHQAQEDGAKGIDGNKDQNTPRQTRALQSARATHTMICTTVREGLSPQLGPQALKRQAKRQMVLPQDRRFGPK